MSADSKEGHDLKISSKSLEDVVGGSSVVHRDPFHIYNEVFQTKGSLSLGLSRQHAAKVTCTMDELFCYRAPLGLRKYGVPSTN